MNNKIETKYETHYQKPDTMCLKMKKEIKKETKIVGITRQT